MPTLTHGTALVIGTTGLILIGPSGAGKSTLAIQLMSDARRSGHFSALVADDQVFIEWVNGRAIAMAPPTIRGLIEIHGSGIGAAPVIEHAALDFAIAPILADSANRIPAENQRWPAGDAQSLPLHFIDRSAPDPMGRLSVLIPGFPVSQ